MTNTFFRIYVPIYVVGVLMAYAFGLFDFEFTTVLFLAMITFLLADVD